MLPNPGCTSRLELACEPSATRYAVGHAKDVLRRWQVPRDVTGDAVLIVDELITNAVRHAGDAAEPFDPERGRPQVRGCALELSLVDGSLLICAHDGSTRIPVLRGVSLDAECGRGLQVVDGLSEGNWGYTLSSAGKWVWARLSLGDSARRHPPRHAADGRVAVIA